MPFSPHPFGQTFAGQVGISGDTARMSPTTTAITWVALAIAVGAATNGVRILVTKTVYPKYLRAKVSSWKPLGLSQLGLAAFVMLETIPRLAGCSAGWILTASLVAVAPLLYSLYLQKSTRLVR
jgi:hypothetical protein